MKNIFKFLGIIALVALIGFSMAACGGDDNPSGPGNELPATSGSLTINGLGSYNGKFAIASGETDNDYELIAAAGASFTASSITGGKITNGSVTLKVWKTGENEPQSYNGNDKGVEFWVMISDTATSSTTMPDPGEGGGTFGMATVSFTNGVGTGSFTPITPF